jgi:hypothetical protein
MILTVVEKKGGGQGGPPPLNAFKKKKKKINFFNPNSILPLQGYKPLQIKSKHSFPCICSEVRKKKKKKIQDSLTQF